MVVKNFNFNRLESAQKFIQVDTDVTCMHTKFGGHSLSGFGNKISMVVVNKISPW